MLTTFPPLQTYTDSRQRVLMRIGSWTVRRFFVPIFAMCLLVLVLAFILPLPQASPYSQVIYDRNGAFLQAFLTNGDIWRLYTPQDAMPERLMHLLLQKEDRYFYYHPGINPFAVVRAAWQNLTAGRIVSGASTITMQVARILEPKDRTIVNKIVEMFRAIQLELRYSKDEILSMYLSMVPLGGNIEGLMSASLLYYKTPPERLNIANLIDLILIPSDPNGLRPDKHGDDLLKARYRQAGRWYREGLLSADEMRTIAETPASVERHGLPQEVPHFALRARQRSRRDATGIVSTLDLPMQRMVERLVRNHVRPWVSKGVRNAAAIVIENATGAVRAYVGSADFGDSSANGQVDAVQALRSPGSTLKPLLYAHAMDRGMLTPRTPLLDIPYDIDGYSAENYDGSFSGQVPADEALLRSLNVPMIRLLSRTGVDPFIDFLHDLGGTSIPTQRDRLGLSLVLGGCGISLEELAGLYAAFPRRGIPVSLSYTVESIPRATGKPLISPSAAYMVTSILADMPRTDLPETLVSAAGLPPIAFKTGTSYGRRDAWCIGYTRTFTVAVWMGNVTNIGAPDLLGQRSATPLLVDVFNSIARNDASVLIDQPGDVGVREICAHSGALPTDACTDRTNDLYSFTYSSTSACTVDTEVMVSSDQKHSFCPSCVDHHPYVYHTYAAFPPELLLFWNRNGTRFEMIPPHLTTCKRVFTDTAPTILSPSNEMTYYIVSEEQRIPMVASSGLDVREHYWYMDGKFVGSKKAGEKTFFRPSAGDHTLTCLDDKGRKRVIRFNVRLLL